MTSHAVSMSRWCILLSVSTSDHVHHAVKTERNNARAKERDRSFFRQRLKEFLTLPNPMSNFGFFFFFFLLFLYFCTPVSFSSPLSTPSFLLCLIWAKCTSLPDQNSWTFAPSMITKLAISFPMPVTCPAVLGSMLSNRPLSPARRQ